MARTVWVLARSFLVIVGIVLLTSFTIDATDALNGSQSALSIFAKRVAESSCPVGMARIDMADRSVCVDVYETSFAPGCDVEQPQSSSETQKNVNDQDCAVQSVAEALPAVFVTFHQAQTLCARRGARLPTPYEWYDAALGTPDSNSCNLNGSLKTTGSSPECQSARGSFDMVGNAWEWVDVAVNNGIYDGAELPETGYVAEADRAGVALKTEQNASDLFNQDYFWSTREGSMGMMRGGFYGSGSDGGIYSVHADVNPTFTSGAIGFRCVMEV